jgi:kynureninase
VNYEASREFARSADAADTLYRFRAGFSIPEARDGFDCVYLCGNSLGLLPALARQYLTEELDD